MFLNLVFPLAEGIALSGTESVEPVYTHVHAHVHADVHAHIYTHFYTHKVHHRLNTDEAAAMGAAWIGAGLSHVPVRACVRRWSMQETRGRMSYESVVAPVRGRGGGPRYLCKKIII